MCARVNRTQDDERDMPDGLMDNIQNALEAAGTVSLHGVGEPLISKQFEPVIERVGAQTRILFNSNGQIMTDGVLNKLLSRPVHSIMFSLDAATEETYHKIRGYGDVTLAEVRENILRLKSERDKRNLQHPQLSICMVMMRVNYREMPDFVRMGDELGCMGVYIWPLSCPSSPSDYTVHERNGWTFNYEEESVMPESELHDLIAECSDIAKKKGIIFYAGR